MTCTSIRTRLLHERSLPFRLLAAGLAAATLALPAWAGRPLVTEDAGLVETGACQLELFTERSRDERTWWAVPACNPWGPVEIGLGAGRSRDEAGDTRTIRSWQLKTVLREHGEDRAGFGLALSDQRDPLLHRGNFGDTELKALMTVPLRGEALLAHTNLGLARERDDQDGAHRQRMLWAAALDWEARPRTRLSFEAYGTGSERPWSQFGIRHGLVPGHVQLDTSVGAQWGRSRDSRYLSLGLVFVTPAFLR